MLIWMLQTALCQAVFFGLYYLLLRNETFHRLNRAYLLSTFILSGLLPLLPTNTAPQMLPTFTYQVTMPAVQIQAADTQAATPTIPWTNLLWGAYIMVSFWLLFKLVRSVGWLVTLRRKSVVQQLEQAEVVESSLISEPFSFWKTIFLPTPNTWSASEQEAIITHELAHVRQMHTFDIMLVSAVKVLFWWSPPVFWYATAMRDVHEYLADEAVYGHKSKRWYGQLLLSHARQVETNALVHTFIRSQLQKRILMMSKPVSSAIARWKFGVIVPAVFFLLGFLPRIDAQELTPPPPPPPPPAPTSLPKGVSSISVNKDKVAVTLKDGSVERYDFLKEAERTAYVKKYGLLHEPPPPPPIAPALGDPRTQQMVPPPPAPPAPPHQGGNAVKAPQAPAPAAQPTPAPAPHHGGIQSVRDTMPKVVEKMPEFQGGMTAMFDFLVKNIKYPEAAKKAEGTVFVEFTVDANGELKDFLVKRSPNELLTAEALRVVKMMPKWIPAEQDGKNVAVRFTLPIKFKAE